jgi:hypothetical protein
MTFWGRMVWVRAQFPMMARRESILSGAPFVATFAGVVLAIVALFSIDTFLAKTEKAESRVEAARFYATGHIFLNGERAQKPWSNSGPQSPLNAKTRISSLRWGRRF